MLKVLVASFWETVMHVIYNWLLNKHICIIILERLLNNIIKKKTGGTR
jgi:hypothetical protein